MATYEINQEDADALVGVRADDVLSASKAMALQTTLSHMFTGTSYFSICIVRDLVEMTGVRMTEERQDAMGILACLHCVDYRRMSVEQLQDVRRLTFFVLGIEVTPVKSAEQPTIKNDDETFPDESRIRNVLSIFKARGSSK